LKRMRPAPQGRGYRVRKRSNHVTIAFDAWVKEEGKGKKVQGKSDKVQEDTAQGEKGKGTRSKAQAGGAKAKKTTKKVESKSNND